MWIRSISFIINMKNVLFNIKSVTTGSSKAVAGAGVGAGAETFWKSEPERKKIVSAPQHWLSVNSGRPIATKNQRTGFQWGILESIKPWNERAFCYQPFGAGTTWIFISHIYLS
jgi:hypothetical protein